MLKCLLVQHEFKLEFGLESAHVLEPASDGLQHRYVLGIAAPDVESQVLLPD